MNWKKKWGKGGKNINKVGIDLIIMKQKMRGGLKNNFWWFSELQEEFRCAAATALQQKPWTKSRYLFWCVKKGLKTEGTENQGSHPQTRKQHTFPWVLHFVGPWFNSVCVLDWFFFPKSLQLGFNMCMEVTSPSTFFIPEIISNLQVKPSRS